MNYNNLIVAIDKFVKKLVSFAFVILSVLIILTTITADSFTDYPFPNTVSFPNYLYYVAAFSLIYIKKNINTAFMNIKFRHYSLEL